MNQITTSYNLYDKPGELDGENLQLAVRIVAEIEDHLNFWSKEGQKIPRKVCPKPLFKINFLKEPLLLKLRSLITS